MSFLLQPGIIFLLLLPSCKSLYDLKNYSKNKAQGSIGAESWSFGYGYTDPEAKLPDGMEQMIVLTTSKPQNACPNSDDKVKDQREIAIAIDGKLGESRLGGSSGQYETEEDLFKYRKVSRQASVAFFDPAQGTDKQYQFATRGKVKITKITKDSIEGAVLARIDKDFFVNGQFKAKICKYGQLN